MSVCAKVLLTTKSVSWLPMVPVAGRTFVSRPAVVPSVASAPVKPRALPASLLPSKWSKTPKTLPTRFDTTLCLAAINVARYQSSFKETLNNYLCCQGKVENQLTILGLNVLWRGRKAESEANKCSFITTSKLRFVAALTRCARPSDQPSAVTPVGRCACP